MRGIPAGRSAPTRESVATPRLSRPRDFGIVTCGGIALVGSRHLALDALAELLGGEGDFIELAHDLLHALETHLFRHGGRI